MVLYGLFNRLSAIEHIVTFACTVNIITLLLNILWDSGYVHITKGNFHLKPKFFYYFACNIYSLSLWGQRIMCGQHLFMQDWIHEITNVSMCAR